MRFGRFDASMISSLPSLVNRRAPKLSFHELGSHGEEPKIQRIVIYVIIKDGREVAWSIIQISSAGSNAVIVVADRVNLLKLHAPKIHLAIAICTETYFG
jgi:hypothetical protein